MSDVAPDLLAHHVTADAGPIHATDLDEPIVCVRLVAHFGVGATHRETFMDMDALDALIAQLVSIRRQVQRDPDHDLRMALLPWVQDHLIRRYGDESVVSHNEAVEELLDVVRTIWSG